MKKKIFFLLLLIISIILYGFCIGLRKENTIEAASYHIETEEKSKSDILIQMDLPEAETIPETESIVSNYDSVYEYSNLERLMHTIAENTPAE